MGITVETELMKGLSPTKTWFTSDTHFFHDKIIGNCQRPFDSIEEMNETLINRWNYVVHRNDVVFHLGDFCFGNSEKWNYILDRLNGKIYLILGNHDAGHMSEDISPRFEGVAFQMRLNVNGQKVYLNHFPFLSYSGDVHGTWQLFGHIHSRLDNYNIIDSNRLSMLQPNQYDVGVDNNNYTPISFLQIQQLMQKQMLNI